MKTPGVLAGIVAAAFAAPALAGDEVRLTHNLNDTRLQYGTIAGIEADSQPPTTRDNTWWRYFYRHQFGLNGDLRVTKVRFGVEQASSSAGWQPITVKLYALEIDLFGETKMTLIEEVTEFIADQKMTLVTIPVDAMLDEHEHLAVSVAPADFGALGMEGSMFFIGANRLGQTAPSFISCPSAGDATPVPYGRIADDAANLAVVMTVFAETGCQSDCDGTGELDFFDYLCFMSAHAAGDPSADCDANGVLDLFDVICFQEEFARGCD
jgi:hypothetical protein